MRYIKILSAVMMIATLFVSCATFDYTNSTNASNSGVISEEDINSLEELMKANGLNPEDIQGKPVDDMEASDQSVYSDGDFDVNDTAQWTELEVPPTEEEIKAMEEAAVQPSKEQAENPEIQDAAYSQEIKGIFPESNIDMSALTPMHMDAVEPTQPGAAWSSADALQIPEKNTSETEQAEPEKTEQETNSVPDIQWDSVEPQESIPVTSFIEAVSVAPEWDMLSEYDKFVAEFGGEIKEADSVNTSSFVVSEPTPIPQTPTVPESTGPAPEFYEPPQTLDISADDIQWETVETEYITEGNVQPATEYIEEQPSDIEGPARPAEPEGENKIDGKKDGGFMSFLSGIWQAISGFFLGIWTWIKNLIGKFIH